MSMTGAGAAEMSRQRGKEVKSLGKMAYAIHNISGMPLLWTSKREVVFSEKGAGVYPIAVSGPWKDVADTFVKYSDVPVKIVMSGKLGFTIHVMAVWEKKLKAVEIHDARGDAAVNIVSFFAGMGASAFQAEGIGTAVNDSGGMVADCLDLSQKLGIKLPKSKTVSEKLAKKAVSIFIHYLPYGKGINTGKSTLTFGELLPYAAACVAKLASK